MVFKSLILTRRSRKMKRMRTTFKFSLLPMLGRDCQGKGSKHTSYMRRIRKAVKFTLVPELKRDYQGKLTGGFWRELCVKMRRNLEFSRLLLLWRDYQGKACRLWRTLCA